MKDTGMSSSLRGRNVRGAPAGGRHHSMDAVPKFPPLAVTARSPAGAGGQRLDKSYQGISGAAMSIPPPRPEDTGREKEGSTSREERKPPAPSPAAARNPSPRRAIPSSKSESSAATRQSEEAAERARQELRDAMVREKELKEKVMSLKKVIDELKAKLRDREKTIEELHEQFKRQEAHYEDLLRKERADHQVTREELERARAAAGDQDTALDRLRREYETKITDLNQMWEERLRVLTEEKDKEISTRDEKLGRLKKQMADALKGNSWERQQQLDELTKELTRIQEESDMLRLKLKSFSKAAKSGACGNCESSGAQLQQTQRLMKDKDAAIKDLKTLCAKFEKQLMQQDSMTRVHQEQKGQKLASLPK